MPNRYQATDLIISHRYALLVTDGVLLYQWEEGTVEKTELRFPPDSPFRPRSLQEFAERLRAQLEARGFALRCFTHNPFPILGGPQYTLRLARGAEGVGIHLKPLEPVDTYRVEVAPADPDPPLSCPAR
ncbi:hypothetical protein EWH23_09675 [Meiothermus sp. PNK-Is4]|nr:hypothetical protein DNA98_04775 [Meiothermus sp. Pnk-1]RYM36532.1 hypothetical protein EWH23_09675 [Meiothermus sp. PNK-Is4]